MMDPKTREKLNRRLHLALRQLSDDMSSLRQERAWDALALAWATRAELLRGLAQIEAEDEL